ncbi:hypothetical protein P4O66_002684 [Electrophorus voltai]|uniref:Ig-like domain-containing protein n=1 Tax=Electrophorus voltai TaxID=2609070 RepID=A0AAD8YX22_9TELE|nr:hypothetical protein P4O66_002684 [Electrophorus voltai]
MRKGEESYQGEGYVNRVNVPGDMLLKGNCSLVMKELRHDDAGVYESYLLVKRPKRALHSERVFIQRIELSVNGTFILCCLQNISTDHKSVSLGENITLHCNITADYEISWYGQSSDELRLLISAGRTNLDKQFSLSYNVDRDHFDTTDSNGSVTLVIINVTENDLGLYYCRGRDYRSLLKFGRTIRLAITGTFISCLHQTPSVRLKSVQPGENVTLHCDIVLKYGVSWYHQSSEDIKMLINTERGKLDNQFFLSYSLEQDHYDIAENNASVSLVITGKYGN